MAKASPENRALAETVFGALNAGDLETFVGLTTEDVEFTSMVAEAEAPTFRGHEGVRTWWETIRGAFEDPHWEVLDVYGEGDHVVAHFRMSGVLGGVRVEQPMWQSARLRQGKAASWEFHRSKADAFAAAGLREA